MTKLNAKVKVLSIEHQGPPLLEFAPSCFLCIAILFDHFLLLAFITLIDRLPGQFPWHLEQQPLTSNPKGLILGENKEDKNIGYMQPREEICNDGEKRR